MKGRRSLTAENRWLRNRLDECQILLAAAALQYGDGKMVITGDAIEQATKDADIRTLGVRLMTDGAMRVDYLGPEPAPELSVTVIEEEAACSST